MQALLYANLTSKTLSTTLRGGAFTFPVLTQGDRLRLSLKTSTQLEGTNVEVRRTLTSAKAAIRETDVPPASGTFALTVGATDTANITWDDVTADLATAVSAALTTASITHTAVRAVDGSVIIDAASELAITIAANCLSPVSEIEIIVWECDGWHHELRFKQSALAFTDVSARVVPLAPSITRIEAGSDVDGFLLAEKQELYVNPAFDRVYRIVRGSKYSGDLRRSNSAAEIATALAPLADTGGIFTVERSTAAATSIAFEGSMKGQSFDLLTVEVRPSNAAGDIELNLDLTSPELAARFRDTNEITLPLEIELLLENEHDADEDEVITFVTDVTIREQNIGAGDATQQDIVWSRPPKPTDYIPFESNQTITGTQFVSVAVADETDKVVDHNLATTNLHVSLYDAAGRRLLDSEYTIVQSTANSLTIGGMDAGLDFPLSGGITSAGPRSAFVADIAITMAQVTGLSAYLTDLAGRVTALEGLFPTAATALLPDAESYSEEWALPDYFEVFPIIGAPSEELQAATAISDITREMLPDFVPPLFPACTEAIADVITLPITNGKVDRPTGAPGKLYRNDSAAAVTISRAAPKVSVDDAYGYGYQLQPGEFASHNGTTWYALTQHVTAGNYYAKVLERVVWSDTITASQLSAGRSLEIRWAMEVAALLANTPWHWHLAIEFATISAEDGAGGDIENETFADPAFSERLILQTTPRLYKFGLRVVSDSEGALTAAALSFGKWSAITAPTSAEFTIRVSLIKPDTANPVTNPRGILALSGFTSSITGDEAYGLATISD